MHNIRLDIGPDSEVEDFLLMIDSLLQPYLNKAVSYVPEAKRLQNRVEYQIRSGGKPIRAAMCVTACEAFCGSYLPALSFAASLEHLHNFTVIEDDITHGDTERRGLLEAWKRFDLPHRDVFAYLSALSILESDYEPQIKVRLMQMICTFGLEAIEGQSIDIILCESDTPSVVEYLQCIKKKTGAFLAMATVGGGVIGGASEQALTSLKKFTMLAGMAFQIKDDLLDLMENKGRSIGSNTLEGRRTLLVICALEYADEREKRKLLSILNKPRSAKTQAEVQWVSELYQRIGAIAYAQQTCEHLIEQAKAHLRILPESEGKERLSRITRYMVTRMH